MITPAERKLIEDAFDGKPGALPHTHDDVRSAIEKAIDSLDRGELRVVEKVEARDGKPAEFIHHEWLKKAILLYFRIREMRTIEAGEFNYVDKIPVKRWSGKEGVRVVPQAIVRKGAFISSGAILMPSYVNIGAFVGSGTMVDTWATVGSCAYIGANVHLSGGVGIGGVLEPIQAKPVIIEDHAFIGSRAIIVEGVHVEEGAVIAAGVTLTASTRIIDVTKSEAVTYRGRVPRNSVVIPGVINKEFPAGTYGTPCALIIGHRKESTNQKTSLTEALREFNVPT